MDVVRVLAVVLLLGNLKFHETHEAELKAVAGLLGRWTPASSPCAPTTSAGNWSSRFATPTWYITSSFRRRLITRDDNVSLLFFCLFFCQSGAARDALAKALYCRTVATIVRRANSLKRLCMSGTLSSDSNDSVHNQAEVASQHASTVGTAGSKSSRSMAVLNTAVRHATDGFIGILDNVWF